MGRCSRQGVVRVSFVISEKQPLAILPGEIAYGRNRIKARCLEWLEENFGIKASRIIDARICEKNGADLIFGITVVKFSFETPSGETMESAAFLKDSDIL
jgi:hypothetical protein